jgi:lysophospholipase L1-like esterase
VTRILAIGDSYTAGEAVPPDRSWPRLLEGNGPGIEVTVVARTGWTAAEARSGLRDADPAGPFDAVTVQVGVNDQYRGGEPADYRRDLEALMDDAVRLAGGDPGRVVVLSIPDWSVTPFAADRNRVAVAAQIDAHNRIAAAVAADLGAALVDVTTTSLEAASDLTLLADDGLHPSLEMYRRWLIPIRTAVEAAVRERPAGAPADGEPRVR